MNEALKAGLSQSVNTWHNAWYNDENYSLNLADGYCARMTFGSMGGFYSESGQPCSHRYLAFCSGGEFATTTLTTSTEW